MSDISQIRQQASNQLLSNTALSKSQIHQQDYCQILPYLTYPKFNTVRSRFPAWIDLRCYKGVKFQQPTSNKPTTTSHIPTWHIANSLRSLSYTHLKLTYRPITNRPPHYLPSSKLMVTWIASSIMWRDGWKHNKIRSVHLRAPLPSGHLHMLLTVFSPCASKLCAWAALLTYHYRICADSAMRINQDGVKAFTLVCIHTVYWWRVFVCMCVCGCVCMCACILFCCCLTPHQWYFSYILVVIWCMRWGG